LSTLATVSESSETIGIWAIPDSGRFYYENT
jgi:hypothetical protein